MQLDITYFSKMFCAPLNSNRNNLKNICVTLFSIVFIHVAKTTFNTRIAYVIGLVSEVGMYTILVHVLCLHTIKPFVITIRSIRKITHKTYMPDSIKISIIL